MTGEEIILEETDQEIESALEIGMIDAGVGIEIFDLGEKTRGIEIACPEMVLLTQGASVEEKIVLNVSARRILGRPLMR
jgi:hypothetical protein